MSIVSSPPAMTKGRTHLHEAGIVAVFQEDV
jgi:hypothetical protein